MIDIIVTTYNNPDSLIKALASLFAQTNDKFKVILVNDASEDKYDSQYEDIIKLFSSLDITYVKNSENLGVGLSRQVGIDNSANEYFIFLDSDDRLLPYAVQLIEDVIEMNSHPDLVVSAFQTQTFVEDKEILNNKSTVLTSNDLRKVLTWCHGKVYRREALNKYKIRLPERFSRVLDDYYFNVLCTTLFDRQVTCNIPFYLWVQTEGSVTHTRHLDKQLLKSYNVDALIDIATIGLQYNKAMDYVCTMLNLFVSGDENFRLKDKGLYNQVKMFLDEHDLNNK